MEKLMILLPNGYEEIEALTVVDFCRRADIEIDMVSITGSIETIGDHNIVIKADKNLSNINLEEYVGLITPGGMPGTKMLESCDEVINIIKKFYSEGKLIASICASPMILEKAMIAKEIEGTIYPGLEKEMNFKKFIEKPVVVYKNVITSRGPATAALFAYKIIEYVKGRDVSNSIKDATLAGMVFK